MFEEVTLLWIHAHHIQILFHSLEKEYLFTNLPWLIGSLGTPSVTRQKRGHKMT